MIENRDTLIHINDNEVKNISECNLLHDIINPPERTKNINSHYSPILHGCMSNRKGRAQFKKFLIILDNGCIYTIVTRRILQKLCPEKDAVMKWQIQARNITSNLKVNVDFNLSTISATNVVMCKCNVDDSAKGSYDIILGRYLLR